MFTPRSAPGSPPRARRPASFGLALLVAGLAFSQLGGAGASRHSQIVLSGYGTSVIRAGAGDSNTSAGPHPLTAATFRISGTISGLYPGLTKPLVLTVSNPMWLTLVVTSISTTVQSPTATCTAANLSVGKFAGQLSVPAFGSRKTTVPATLAQNTPNACIGARFLLRYNGLGWRI